MTAVGEHGLTCLSDTDAAAVALSMQANANAIDLALAGTNDSLNGYLGRWWWSASNTSTMNIADNSGTVLPENLTGADLFTDGGSLSVRANGFPATASFAANFDWPDGIYMVGSTIKWTVATPNSNTPRTLMVAQVNRVNGQASISPPGPGGPVYMSTEYERSAAGNDGALSVCGIFQVGSGMNRFAACFSHGNTSSVLVALPGWWRLWFLRLGSGLVV